MKNNRDSVSGRFIKTEHPQAHERFVTFLEEDPERGCWLWTGATKSQMGYGAFALRHGTPVSAHTWAYEHFRELVPAGLELDHLCRNPLCTNPWHLEAVTRRVNLQRGINWNREKTHCSQGHPYAGDNLYINPSSGSRVCRTCCGVKNLNKRRRSPNRK